jgi:hypothetical protein
MTSGTLESRTAAKPTVVLVNGVFADSSNWTSALMTPPDQRHDRM